MSGNPFIPTILFILPVLAVEGLGAESVHSVIVGKCSTFATVCRRNVKCPRFSPLPSYCIALVDLLPARLLVTTYSLVYIGRSTIHPLFVVILTNIFWTTVLWEEL